MKANLIELWALQVNENEKMKEYKTANRAVKAFENAKSKLKVRGEIVRLFQFTDVINNVEEIEFFIK